MIVKRVLFHSITALTGWAGFCCSSVAAFASGATCKKEQINAKMVDNSEHMFTSSC